MASLRLPCSQRALRIPARNHANNFTARRTNKRDNNQESRDEQQWHAKKNAVVISFLRRTPTADRRRSAFSVSCGRRPVAGCRLPVAGYAKTKLSSYAKTSV